jgi:hypothetical protein
MGHLINFRIKTELGKMLFQFDFVYLLKVKFYQ